MKRWADPGILAVAAIGILGAWHAGAKADEFASQGQACGSPGHPMDMSRIYAAVRQYRNGRLVFLTPAEEGDMRERLRQENEAGRSPLQEMAPCFGCTQDRSACIVYDGPDQRPAQAPDSYGSNGGNQPPPPPGSALTGFTMSVNFNNRSDQFRDTPDIPQEPPMNKKGKVNAKKC